MQDGANTDAAELREVLHQLRVLSNIRENDRVGTRRGIHLDRRDDPLSVVQGVQRWFRGEGRDANLDAIGQVFQRATDLCDALLGRRRQMRRRSGQDSRLLAVRLLENSQSLRRLQADLKAAIRGVGNLSITYGSDTHSKANISLMRDLATDRLERIQLQMKDQPEGGLEPHCLKRRTANGTPPGKV